LPAGSVVQFRPESPWRRYLWPAAGGLVFMLMQAALIIGLLVERRRRGRTQRALAEQLRFETLIGNLLAEFSALAPEQVDEHIDAWLALIVGTLAIDRAGIAQITDDGECLVFTHAVLSDDAASAPTTPTMRVPSAVARLRDGHAVTVSHLDHLPPDAATDRQ